MPSRKAKTSAEELIMLLLGVMRSIQIHLKKSHAQDLRPCSPLQIQVLGYLQKHERPSMKEVADFLSITPPSATSIIDSMANDGLLKRQLAATDRRTIHLCITAKGRNIFKYGFRQITLYMREIFSCLTDTERKQMINIYKKIFNYFNKSLKI